MVFLSLFRLAQIPKPDRRWRKMELLRQSWSFYGRRREEFRTRVRSVRKAQMNAGISRQLKKSYSRQLWHQRLAAACEEHGMNRHDFLEVMAESNIALNRKVLCDMAIYEPRTFQVRYGAWNVIMDRDISLLHMGGLLARSLLSGVAEFCPHCVCEKSLVLFAKQRHEEIGLFGVTLEPKPRIFSRDFLKRV